LHFKFKKNQSKEIIYIMAQLIRMPRLSDSMEEGELIAWHKKVGDTVAVGDLLAEIQTDKSSMDFDSPEKGVLLYIGIPDGGKLVVGAPLAVIGKAGEAFESLLGGGTAAAKPTPKSEPAPAAEATKVVETVETHNAARIFSSPLAREIAKQQNIPLSAVKGSGDNGRIVRRDVEEAIQKVPQKPAPAIEIVPPPTVKPTPTPVAEGRFTDKPLSNMRKIIAQRLSDSKQTAPHFYLTAEIDMEKAMATRTQINELAAPTKISFNDMIVKAVAAALKKHPVINSSWMGDKIREHQDVHVGVAVAIADGLIVPVVRDADKKSLSQINSEVRELAGRAKEMRLKADEISGSTFTISNLGMFEVEEFTAIINPPNACILAVGAILQKAIVKNGALAVGNMMRVTLSCDHRVVDGATGAQFLQTLKGILQEPIKLMI
jgi:pyruvate dehydrogenase E2 component (dihydrolipoamide acetyltransferase)